MINWKPKKQFPPKDGRTILAWFGGDHCETVFWGGEYWVYAYDGDAPMGDKNPLRWCEWKRPG